MLSNQTAQLNIVLMALSTYPSPLPQFPAHYVHGRKSAKCSALNQLANIRIVAGWAGMGTGSQWAWNGSGYCVPGWLRVAQNSLNRYAQLQRMSHWRIFPNKQIQTNLKSREVTVKCPQV